MELVIEKKALKTLRALQPKTRAAIVRALEGIAAEPFAQHQNVERLRGVRDGFRLRHGDWRVLYRLDRRAKTVRIEAIRPRGEVYKG